MPSLDTYIKMHKTGIGINGNKTIGQSHKEQSDIIMEATWDRDISTRICYLYDYWHDEYRDQNKNLLPEKDKNKIPISLKYLANSSQTYDKDYITYHIQMKPSQKCNVPYYKEYFEDRFNGTFPLGLYIDIPNNKGIYDRWLIVNTANYYDAQFSTYEILPCDYVFNWIWKGQKIKMAGVLRSQNSYNSGIWRDYRLESVEDQQKFVVPLNSLSEKLFYNQRMIIDTKIDVNSGAQPRAWRISKVNRISPSALTRITLAQDHFDEHADYIEYEEENNPSSIIGMWADYYDSFVEPEDFGDPIVPTRIIIISYNSLDPEIKIKGSSVILSVNIYDGTEESYKSELPFEPGDWSFLIDNQDVSEYLEIKYPEDNDKLKENQVEIRFVGPNKYIGKVLCIKYKTNQSKGADYISGGYAELSIVGL